MDDAEIRREFERFDGRIRAMEAVPMTVATHGTEIAMMKDDLIKLENKLDSGFEKVHDRISAFQKEIRDARSTDAKALDKQREDDRKAREARIERERSERKKDRWTFLGITVAAVGAVGWIVLLLTGAPG